MANAKKVNSNKLEEILYKTVSCIDWPQDLLVGPDFVTPKSIINYQYHTLL